jgi:hypothetical protein
MRNIEVVRNFINGATKGKTTNLYIDGDKLINYTTTLLQRHNGKFIVNISKYSSSTSRIQSMILKELPEYGVKYKVGNLHRGVSNLLEEK